MGGERRVLLSFFRQACSFGIESVSLAHIFCALAQTCPTSHHA